MVKSTSNPFVTILVPCRNEVRYIDGCLLSILMNTYDKNLLEVLVIDGVSDDGTRKEIERIAAEHPSVRLVDNPKQTTPAALNVGIQQAKGDVLIRMDAHATYPSDYISKLIDWQRKTGADNVGGIRIAVAADRTSMATAIACGVSHPFGVGTSNYQVGLTTPKWVDTVWGGCFKKELFQTLGLFDEHFVRNQDDEFNHRLIAQGGRVLLVPDVQAFYVARNSLLKLWRMYYQYGYFKPLTVHKLGKVMTMRQLVPAAMVMVGTLSLALASWFSKSLFLFLGLSSIYLIASLALGIQIGMKKGWRCGLWMPVVFPTIHLSYGIGFLQGALTFWFLPRQGDVDMAATPLSR
ncbi:MAG: Putative Succinoglycan biosynthesis protein ExoA [Nitrospira sp.]|nr:glycosyltransferase family 2 protein [Nitrospira sp.]ULA60415.1 MAG: Putative Succinoglycan biosynthesis protein ExoA [Nitrospira sp.]